MAGISGVSRSTGAAIDGLVHLGQSIADILTTPKGTRVMRRDYGSDLISMLDRPINSETLVDIYAEVAAALDDWEPRLSVDSVAAYDFVTGGLTLDISGTYTPDGTEITLEGIVL